MRYAIVGPGRSGTKMLAVMLTAAGLPTTHEGFYDFRWAPDRQHDAIVLGDSSWMASLILDAMEPSERPPAIAAALRRPDTCVRSFVEIGFYTDAAIGVNPCHQVVRRYAPEVYEWERPADRALAHWIALTERALRLAGPLFRLEEFDRVAFHWVAEWAAFRSEITPDVDAFDRVYDSHAPVNQNPLDYDRRTWGEPYAGWGSHPSELRARAISVARHAGYDMEGYK